MRAAKILAFLCAVLLFAGCHAEENRDRVSPAINGTHAIHYTRGRPLPDLLKDVSAVDETDGEVPVEADDSAVNWDELGEYSVVYKAWDQSGNYAQKTVKVFVDGYRGDPVMIETVEALADDVLAGLLTEDITDREKAERIYDWIVGHAHYYPSPEVIDTMGKLPEAAYIGLTDGGGNCYTFFAMSEVLLTRAGIPNIPATLDEPEHYWSLVRIDGEWLHFDATPAISNPDFRLCLATDEEAEPFGPRYGWTYDPADMAEWEESD
ncbi:MAG: transglutaminase family protein [Clostridiales bacterium]|nr:transglutaminase family protein [Clostridiales bacterium]